MLTVVREGTNLLHHEPATPDSLRTSTGAVVGVLPEDTSVFLVDADNVLDGHRASVVTDVCSRLLSHQFNSPNICTIEHTK